MELNGRLVPNLDSHEWRGTASLILSLDHHDNILFFMACRAVRRDKYHKLRA